MTGRKTRVGILFGGRSAEHEVSVQSAKSVADAIDRSRYEVALIGIDKSGRWLFPDQSRFLLDAADPTRIALDGGSDETVMLVPQGGGALMDQAGARRRPSLDVVFPLLHGPFGEDGTIQGLLKLACVPFVGAGVLGSAVGMDKDVMKRLLRDAGIPTAKFMVFDTRDRLDFDAVRAGLGVPVFVKPANLGSSVGVSKAAGRSAFDAACRDAFLYDTKILVEEFVEGRELECAVLGNKQPAASVVGEIVPSSGFYSYEAKYIDEHGAALVVPARLTPGASDAARALAIRTFKALACEGLSRVDFFLRPDGRLVVNEINTMPGFTKISMYPRLWAASGVPYAELINRLIELAMERFAGERGLKTSL